MKKQFKRRITRSLASNIAAAKRSCADTIALIDWILLVENPRLENNYELMMGNLHNNWLDAREELESALEATRRDDLAPFTSNGYERCSFSTSAQYLYENDDACMEVYAAIAEISDERITGLRSARREHLMRRARRALEACDFASLQDLLEVAERAWGARTARLTRAQGRAELERLESVLGRLDNELNDIAYFTPYAFRDQMVDPAWIGERVMAFSAAAFADRRMAQRIESLLDRDLPALPAAVCA